MHHLLDDRPGGRPSARHDLSHRLADVVRGGDAVHLGQRLVDPDEAHLLIEQGDAGRSTTVEVVEGLICLFPAPGLLFRTPA